MFYAAALLTALAGGLTWWTLRRELAPLLTTATQLAALPAGKNFPLALKVTRQDEIGQLIGGFNRLLETLRQREAALLDNEKQLRQLSRITEQAQIAIVITDLQGVIEYVNPKFVEVTGFGADEVVGRNPRILQSGKTPADTYSSLWNTLSSGGIWHGEFLNRKKNGEVFVEQAVIAPVLDPQGIATHYVAIKQDITVLKESQLEQERLLGEKTALLNEVHHRVKNNLQVITSLLRLEEGRTLQVDTKTVLRDMQGRIRSMALIHETLYRSGNFAEVNLHSHLGQVASVAFRAQVATVVPVRLVLDLAPARTSMDQATPCGLLVNELISNSLKHGFTAGQGGEVRVQLQPAPAAPDSAGNPAPWCLRVRDTGIGLPADFDVRRSQSLGLRLVSDLARQLGGTLHVEPGPGAAFSVTFPIKGHREI